jgi:cell wall-associated NlpC family hydrolase
VLTLGVVAPAGAAPSGTSGSTGVTGSTPDLDTLNERWNLAKLRVDQATAAVQAADWRIQTLQDEADRVQDAVRARSARLYMGAAGGGVVGLLDVQSVGELARRTTYVGAAVKPDQALLARLTKTLDQLGTQRRASADAVVRLRAEADAANAARRTLMAQAAAAQQLAAAAQAQAIGSGAGPIGTPLVMGATSSASGSSTPVVTPGNPKPPGAPPSSGPSFPPPPPASSKAAIAIAYARAQLGKPYVFGAAGPDAFDCSGLTMMAWRAAGVSMAHYSGSQAAAFPKVSWDQLQPGDILVFYSDYHHVGLYIGGGQMIQAPHTGDVVKISPAWRTEFQFGVRPG